MPTDYNAVPLGQPILRWNDLDANSTRWDKLLAAPADDHTLVQMWRGFAGVSLVAATVIAVIVAGILYSPATRQSAFNLYLVFCLLPDFWLSFSCFFVCYVSSVRGHFASAPVCRYESWYTMFAIGASAWTNFNIMREVYKMLRSSHQRKRYYSPTLTQVIQQECIVYAYCGGLASLGIAMPKAFPLRTYPVSGYACGAVEYDRWSSLFFNLVYFPLLAGLPMLYVLYVNADVLYRQLLPNDPRVRQFAIYFLRIVVLFFVWWLPAILFVFMVAGTPPWFKWFWSAWVHCQGIASAGMCLLKADIYGSTKAMLTCSTYDPPRRRLTGSHRSRRKTGSRPMAIVLSSGESTTGRDDASHMLQQQQQQQQSSTSSGAGFHDDDTEAGTTEFLHQRTMTEEFNIFAASGSSSHVVCNSSALYSDDLSSRDLSLRHEANVLGGENHSMSVQVFQERLAESDENGE